ncbi:hypothetical protein [Xenorhabdus miraniensis]
MEEFNALLRDPEVRCIMLTVDSYNPDSILPYIDYNVIKN